MNVQASVEKYNKDRAEALYNRERAKTSSEKYLDFFIKYSNYINDGIKKLNGCVSAYKERGDEYVAQIPLITPHINMLKAYGKELEVFMRNLSDNIAVEKEGTKVYGILKMRNEADIDTLFNALESELQFVDYIAEGGAFDVIVNRGNIIQRIIKSKQR